MFDLDKWSEIFQTLLRNKSRTFLTAFGIFWGIFMLVLLMGGSKGFQEMIARNFDGFAQKSYVVWAQNTSLPYKGFQRGRSWSFENKDINRVRTRIEGIEVATPMLQRWGLSAKYKEKKFNVVVKGVHSDYDQVENPKLMSGRFIQTSDVNDFRKVCVIGKEVATNIFPDDKNPVGKFIELGGIYYQVVGISSNDSNMSIGGPSRRSVLIPFTTYQRLYNIGTTFDLLAVTGKDGYTMTELQPKIEALLKELHSVHPDDNKAVMGINIEAMYQMTDSLFNAIRILVWMIGIGTLLSGAIGVSNIMMVVVKERTTEIGIRRAIGAKPSDILSQILSESVVITIMAGLSGIVFAVLILVGLEAGMAMSNPDSVPPNFQITFGMALVAGAALSFLGITAGIAPALRALAIKPIEAIRDE